MSGLTESLIDTVNGGVADVFEEQKQIDGEARALRAKSQKFAQVTGEWVRIVEGFDERLRASTAEAWNRLISVTLAMGPTLPIVSLREQSHRLHSAQPS